MCGIAGYWSLDLAPVPEELLRSMASRIAHRGPDGAGVRVAQGAGLAHRRLAIIDLTGGVQPMSNEDGTVWVTYNGEIYNHAELREELREHGHRFQTWCDTEVVVHAFEQWGERCVERFRGMFAFAVLDERQGILFLARDRLGIKPLCYLAEPHRFAFASELQSLQALENPPSKIDVEALDLYLNLGFIPAPQTIFRDVAKLPPGHTLTVTRSGGVGRPQCYWDVRFDPDTKPSESEWMERLEDALKDAVRVRLMSDVPFGAFLSGGTDSSAVVAYMSEILQSPVKTFSIGFDCEQFSELPYARQVAQRFGTEHYEEVVRPDALAVLPDVVRHHGEPFGDSSAIPTYYVSRLAARHVKMVLSGDGGDEVFAGYPWYERVLRAFVCPQGASESLRWAGRRLLKVCKLLPEKTDPVKTWYRGQSILGRAERRRLWQPELAVAADLPRRWLAQHAAEAARYDLCSQLQYLDIKGYLPGDILAKVDIASMAHSLETRVPLLDHKLVELCARIPWGLKLNGAGGGRMKPKSIFRKVIASRLGEDFLNRPKRGFSVPLRDWFTGESRDLVRERLCDPGSRLSEFLQRKQVERLVASHGNGRDASARLWLLLILAEWLQQNPHAGA